TISWAAGCFRSRAMDRRPRLSSLARAAGSPAIALSTRSTRMTSAPRSASSIAAYGPGPRPAISITVRPTSGPCELILPPSCLWSPASAGQPEGALAEQVLHDLGRTRVDRLGPRRQHRPHPFVARRIVGAQPGRPQHVDGQHG